MWELILECGGDILLFFEDLKFWKKKRARRKFEKKHGLPKRTMVYPSFYYYLISTIILMLLIGIFFLVKILYFNTNEQLEKSAELELLLKAEKEHIGVYPAQLRDVIRKNPLLAKVHFDIWGNEYHYEVINDGQNFILQSKGKDGILNTEDDIINSR